VKYVLGWFDSIGFMLAMGWEDFEQIRKALTLPCVRGEDRRPNDRTHEVEGWCDAHNAVWFTSRGSASCRRSWIGYDANDPLLRILDYLEANYIPNAWAQIGNARS
jgi:hypothetical protein